MISSQSDSIVFAILGTLPNDDDLQTLAYYCMVHIYKDSTMEKYAYSTCMQHLGIIIESHVSCPPAAKGTGIKAVYKVR